MHPNTKVIIHYWLCEYITGDAYNADDAENNNVKWVSKHDVKNVFTSDFFKPVKEYLEN